MARWGWALAGLIVVAAGTIALLPLRLATGPAGLVADETSGSIWRGHLRGAAWHGIALGDLETSARAWPPAMNFTGPAVRGRLTAAGVEGLSGTIDNVEGLPLAQIAFDNVTVAMEERGCTHAGGIVAVHAQPLPQLGALSGPLRCENGVLRALLAPEQGDASLDLTLDAQRRYRAVLRVDGLPAVARMLLLAAGFEATQTGARITRTGQLGTAGTQ